MGTGGGQQTYIHIHTHTHTPLPVPDYKTDDQIRGTFHMRRA